MTHRDVRRLQTEGARLQFALQVLLQKGEEIFILIVFVGAHIDGEAALIGYHVVLTATVDDGHRHLAGPQQPTRLAEFVVANEQDVIQRLVDGVHPLLAGRMSTLAVGHGVDHHQPLLGNGRLHAGGFAHDGHINLRQKGQRQRDAVGSAHLLFARGQIHQIVASCFLPLASCFLPIASQIPIHLQQAHQPTPTVVAAQSVESVALDGGRIGVACPAAHGFHRVDVRIEQQRGLVGVQFLLHQDVVADACHRQSASVDEIGQNIGCHRFVAAGRRCADELAEQLYCFLCECVCVHICVGSTGVVVPYSATKITHFSHIAIKKQKILCAFFAAAAHGGPPCATRESSSWCS